MNAQLNLKIALLALLVLQLSCGKAKTGKSDDSGKDDDANGALACLDKSEDLSPTAIRLKGTSLLAQSLEYTLGPGKDINVNANDERLLETYSSNFGNTQGLSFGEIYADVKTSDIKMTGYMMGLNIIAYNAALRCTSSQDDERCKCGDEKSAAAMLSRAVPYMRFCNGGKDEFVMEFAELCAEDSVSAITALISSVAFAMRN